MIDAECLGCGEKFQAKDALAGKKVRCPSCGDPVTIPGTPAPAPQPSAAPTPSKPASVRKKGAAGAENPFDFSGPSATPAGAAGSANGADTTPPAKPKPAPVKKKAAEPDNPFAFGEAPPPCAAAPARSSPPKYPVSKPVKTPRPAPAASSLDFTETPAPADVLEEIEADDRPSGRPRRKPAANTRLWPAYGAVVGALIGAAVLAAVRPSGEPLVQALAKQMPAASAEAIRGTLVGLCAGLGMAGLLVAVVGRNAASLGGAGVLVLAGAGYGAFRRAEPVEAAWTLLVLAALAGLLLGALLGWLVGAMKRGSV